MQRIRGRVFQHPSSLPNHLFRAAAKMAAHVTRLARLITPEYISRINAQLVHPASSVVVKPNELQSALSRPLNVVRYEPERDGTYLAATLAFGLINGA